MNAATDLIARTGSSFTSSYGGQAVAGDHVDVFVVEPADALKAALTATSLSIPVTYAPVANPLSALSGLTRRIADDQDALAADNVALSMWGSDPIRNRVVVTLQHYSDDAAALVYARYGSDLINVTPHSPAGPNVLFSGHDAMPS